MVYFLDHSVRNGWIQKVAGGAVRWEQDMTELSCAALRRSALPWSLAGLL